MRPWIAALAALTLAACSAEGDPFAPEKKCEPVPGQVSQQPATENGTVQPAIESCATSAERGENTPGQEQTIVPQRPPLDSVVPPGG